MFQTKRQPRPSRRSLILAFAGAATLTIAAIASARTLDNNIPAPRITQPQVSGFICGPARHLRLAAQQTPARTEMRLCARDLPRGAAAPATDGRPPVYDNLGRLVWREVTPNAEARPTSTRATGWPGASTTPRPRAFRAAQELDPGCAMCFWGEVRQGSSIKASPDHPAAIHLYIHMVEASERPERAAPHAARLAALMPGAGHIVHMPSHIWYRLGMWRDSLEANRQAAIADEAFIAGGGASLPYGQGYYAHNLHFVLVTALMGGDGRIAIEAAGKLASVVSERAQREVPWSQPIAAAPYVAHVQFSSPDTILALPAPASDFR
jgi:hypothetical protein